MHNSIAYDSVALLSKRLLIVKFIVLSGNSRIVGKLTSITNTPSVTRMLSPSLVQHIMENKEINIMEKCMLGDLSQQKKNEEL